MSVQDFEIKSLSIQDSGNKILVIVKMNPRLVSGAPNHFSVFLEKESMIDDKAWINWVNMHNKIVGLPFGIIKVYYTDMLHFIRREILNKPEMLI